MKKLIALLLGVTMMMSLVACGGNANNPKGNESNTSTIGGDPATWGPSTEDDGVQIPNPFTSCATMEEASSISGFNITAPNSIDGYSERSIVVMDAEMIQVTYGEDEQTIVIRKAIGENDCSGDYNVYVKTSEVTINNTSVTFKGNDDMVNVATWTEDGYSFSIGIYDTGLSTQDVIDLVAAID